MANDDLLAQFDGGGENAVSSVAPEEIDRILLNFWSIRGTVRSLVAERDEIVEVVSDDGRRFVLKIYSAGEAVELAELRASASNHIARRDPHLPVPKIIPVRGNLQAVAEMDDGSRRVAQLMTFLEGVPQVDVARSAKQAVSIGRALARTAVALSDFRHPADRRNLVWDLANACKVRSLLPVDRTGRWALPSRILARFQDHTAQRLETLPSQVIHNDFNGHNLLMDPADSTRLTGIIDFGDVARSQRINDLAIAACYQLRFDEGGLAGSTDVVAGYHAVSPLSDDEIAILFDLILTRLAVAVTITEFRASRLPHRAAQILKNTGYAWRALEHLKGIDPDIAANALFAACNKETVNE